MKNKNRETVERLLTNMSDHSPVMYRQFCETMQWRFTQLIEMAEIPQAMELSDFIACPADEKLIRIDVTTEELQAHLKKRLAQERAKASQILMDIQAGKLCDKYSGEVAAFPYPDINKRIFGIQGTLPEIIKKINLPQFSACCRQIIEYVSGPVCEIYYKESEVASV